MFPKVARKQPMKVTMRLLAGIALFAGWNQAGWAQAPTVADLLARKPIQPNVKYTTPAANDLAACKVEVLNYPKPASGPAPTGYLVRDGQGKIIRQFVDTSGRNQPNIVSYYFEGVEAYREIDTDGNGKPDTFRWLGANGGRIGRDRTGSGTVESWEAAAGLTAEETSQELFTALAMKDARRFQSLLVTDEELAAIGLPPGEITKLKTRRDAAMKRFTDATGKFNFAATDKWIHLEAGLPHVVPSDAFNGTADSVRHKAAAMLIDRGNNKIENVACGEMILVGAGRVWKLIDGPGDAAEETGATVSAAVRPWLDKLSQVPPPAPGAGIQASINYHLERAKILEEIVKLTQGAEQEPWIKQLIDAYTAAGEQGDASGYAVTRLTQWKDSIEKVAPGSAIAAYLNFRLLTVDYSQKIRTAVKPDDVNKAQTWWKSALEVYIDKYKTSEDAPDAMMRLAMAHEFSGKEGEELAVKVCEKLVNQFPQHSFAQKATGIIRRLKSEGQAFALSGPVLGTNQPFDLTAARDQVVLVYYWASWGSRLAEEAKLLADLEKKFAGKLTIVTVNLDDKAETATQSITAAGLKGVHLYQPGGIDANPLAVSYGIMGPHLFLIGKDGKMANKNAQLPVLADEIEKMLK